MDCRGPSKPRPPRQLEPTLRGAPPSPVNVPLPARPKLPQGLSVLWTVYRGPAGAVFEPEGYVKVEDGKVQRQGDVHRSRARTRSAPSRRTACSARPADVSVTVGER